MKVIIADDELRICTLIKELIDWDGLGLELCGVYQNALGVLDHLSREKIDILLCDIEMPGMNGLDLIEHVSKEFPDCKFIISGYRNITLVCVIIGIWDMENTSNISLIHSAKVPISI